MCDSIGPADVVVILAPPDPAAVNAQLAGDKVSTSLVEGIDATGGRRLQHRPLDASQIPRLDLASEDKFCCAAFRVGGSRCVRDGLSEL